MKKMLYIGHIYHLKTKSNLFLIKLLEEEYIITFISYDPYEDQYIGIEEALNEEYDVLLLWQIMPQLSFLVERFNFHQGVLFPMYDYLVSLEDEVWNNFRDFKIINFCRKVHEDLIHRGYNSYYIQYFPRTLEAEDIGSLKSVFFWQRMENINVNVIEKLFENEEIECIHVHKSMDPEQKYIEPHDKFKFKIEYSDWFDSLEDMHLIMEKSAFYVAPRLYEGIGMSFLEAMAMGRFVIAPDTPTMNEYITDGVNGVLYNLSEVKPISVHDVRRIQENAKQYIKNGYKNWEKNKYKILEWMKEEVPKPQVTVITVVKNAVKEGRKKFFRQCIESVHNQYYQNIEHLIVDGKSTDGTLGLLRKYKELGWIDYISEEDSGIYEAMNKGIRKAKGDYIVFLNTDDYFHNPEAVKESIFSLINSGADFSFASNRLLKENGVCNMIRRPEMGSVIVQMPFCHQTMFVKKSVLLKEGLFNENYKSSADYDLVLRLVLKGYKYVEVETDIVTYRNGGMSESQQMRSDMEKYEIFKRLYKPYYPRMTDELARRLAGRECPKALYDSLITSLPEKIAGEIEDASLGMDEEKDCIYFSEEITIPIKTEIEDEARFRISQENLKLIESIKEEKHKSNLFERKFNLLDRWLWLKHDNKQIKDFFSLKGYHSLAIYGIGEVAFRFYEEIVRTSNISILYTIEKDRNKTHPELQVYYIDDEFPEVDVIVMADDDMAQDVKIKLVNRVKCPVITIEDIIYCC